MLVELGPKLEQFRSKFSQHRATPSLGLTETTTPRESLQRLRARGGRRDLNIARKHAPSIALMSTAKPTFHGMRPIPRAHRRKARCGGARTQRLSPPRP